MAVDATKAVAARLGDLQRRFILNRQERQGKKGLNRESRELTRMEFNKLLHSRRFARFAVVFSFMLGSYALNFAVILRQRQQVATSAAWRLQLKIS
jgi:hypothetical protein